MNYGKPSYLVRTGLEDMVTSQPEQKFTPNEIKASKSRLRLDRETIVVLDFGSQYSRLICRRIREADVYAELLPWNASPDTIRALQPIGLILSGGPSSVYEEEAPTLATEVLELGVPILGICYGMQLLAHQLGGKVTPALGREYGAASILLEKDRGKVFRGLPSELSVWMSHGDHVEEVPPRVPCTSEVSELHGRNGRQHGPGRTPISSGGSPYASRTNDHRELLFRHLWSEGRLDDWVLHRRIN